MVWKFKDGLPVYLQIIEQFKLEIASGNYKPGSKVKSVRELAIEANVNPNTMQRALMELERENILYTQRTSGRFVVEDQKILDELKNSICSKVIEDMLNSLYELGMSNNDILSEIKDRLGEG